MTVDKELELNFGQFFIVGRGRSGTTLIRLLLDAHPAVAVPPEGQFIIWLHRKYTKTRWNKNKIISFHNDLMLEERLDDWGLDQKKLRQDLLALEGEVSFSDLCMLVYYHYALASGKDKVTTFGDKNPLYSLFLDELISLFPRSKFIHVVRDHRDNILSYQSAKFDTYSTSSLACRWKKYNENILKYAHKYPERFIRVRHEDILTNPVRHLERICSFLEINYDSCMLEFYKTPWKAPKWWEWHKKFVRPLDKSRVYMWKNKMKENDVIKADYICREISHSLGYKNINEIRSAIIFFTTLPGVLYGIIITYLERVVFLLPIKILTNIVYLYRKVTGTSNRKN